jgi:hypothetical protein
VRGPRVCRTPAARSRARAAGADHEEKIFVNTPRGRYRDLTHYTPHNIPYALGGLFAAMVRFQSAHCGARTHPSGAFYGRSLEAQSLVASIVDGNQSRVRRAFIIHGETQMGKTALALHVAQYLTARKYAPLFARGFRGAVL